MTRIATPATAELAPAAAQPLLDAVRRQLGSVPNLFRVVANSPRALEAYIGFGGALAKGAIDARTRERIALAIGELNGCGYCLSAHAYLATNLAKLDAAEIARNRRGGSADPKADAAVRFAAAVATERGRVDDGALSAVRAAGYDDGEIVEIVAHVALNVFTNYLNEVARTEIDFPVVASEVAA